MVGFNPKRPTSVHLKGFVYILKRKPRKSAKNNVPYFFLLQGVYIAFNSYQRYYAGEYYAKEAAYLLGG